MCWRLMLVGLVAIVALPVGVAGAIAAGADAGGTPAASPIADCPYPQGVEIPGAKEYFVEWGLGDPRFPVWLAGFGSPSAEARAAMASPIPTVRYMTAEHNPYVPGYGWFFKALWVIGGGFTQTVTVTGANVNGGPPLAFELGMDPIVFAATLDPQHPEIPVQHDDFREFPSYLFFPATGCYELTARWDGGGWSIRIPFVAPYPPSAATPVPGARVTPRTG